VELCLLTAGLARSGAIARIVRLTLRIVDFRLVRFGLRGSMVAILQQLIHRLGEAHDRQVLSYGNGVLVMRWVSADANTRYGTMVYVRCAA